MSLLSYSDNYLPIYPELVEITKKHERMHWHEGEAKLQGDVEQWKNLLTPYEKGFIASILRLFTQLDVSVGKDYYENLIPVMKNNEARNMLGSFAAREGTHQRAYALLNDTLGMGDAFYNEFLNFKEMYEKVEFIEDVNNEDVNDIMLSIAKQVVAEGVMLFGSFAMLLNFSRQGKMLGMADVVRWSIKDESVHVEGLSKIYEILENTYGARSDPFKAQVYQTARDCVNLEDEFIDLVFEYSRPDGITAPQMKDYVRSLTDYRMLQLGFKSQFGVENPLEWMDWIVSNTSSESFFEVNTANYSKNSMKGSYGDYWN